MSARSTPQPLTRPVGDSQTATAPAARLHFRRSHRVHRQVNNFTRRVDRTRRSHLTAGPPTVRRSRALMPRAGRRSSLGAACAQDRIDGRSSALAGDGALQRAMHVAEVEHAPASAGQHRSAARRRRDMVRGVRRVVRAPHERRPGRRPRARRASRVTSRGGTAARSLSRRCSAQRGHRGPGHATIDATTTSAPHAARYRPTPVNTPCSNSAAVIACE